MAGRVEGKVALITGAARGQGRSHAVRLAQEGADIIAIDACAPISSVTYSLPTPSDLQQTAKEVEALGRRVVAAQVDIRDFAALSAAVDGAVEQLGRLDIVAANAGICSSGRLLDVDEMTWQEMLDITVTGTWHTAKATVPHLRAAGGGSMILTSSTLGIKAAQNVGHYVTAKHGVTGIMRTLALELGPERIRVNCIAPGSVDTDMIHNKKTYSMFAPDLTEDERTRDRIGERFATLNAMHIPWVDPIDISNAVLWLASDEARYVTGATIPVDAGQLAM
jgi:(+)-trans-carveol dehydrogenase